MSRKHNYTVKLSQKSYENITVTVSLVAPAAHAGALRKQLEDAITKGNYDLQDHEFVEVIEYMTDDMDIQYDGMDPLPERTPTVGEYFDRASTGASRILSIEDGIATIAGNEHYGKDTYPVDRMKLSRLLEGLWIAKSVHEE